MDWFGCDFTHVDNMVISLIASHTPKHPPLPTGLPKYPLLLIHLSLFLKSRHCTRAETLFDFGLFCASSIHCLEHDVVSLFHESESI